MRCWETVLWGPSLGVPTHPGSALGPETSSSCLEHNNLSFVPGCGFRETYLVFDTLQVIIPHPLVAPGSKGNLLARDSMYFSSSEEAAYLKEQDRVVWEACRASRSHPSEGSLPLQAASFMQIYEKEMQMSQSSAAFA